MKILDRYILTSFVSTLFTVFIILYFIFILQGIWLFITELAGKDLDFFIIVQFLLFYSPKMIPLVLPLSVLLASIMTFGNFAEHYEFAAMKASGISLKRAMQPLSIFIAVLALISFWFANDVIPKAEYRFINMRKEILQTKPAMAIAAGQFNDVGAINIKVDKKTGEKGQYLENVTMHIKSASGYDNKAVIRSVDGELESDNSSSILQLHLFDGNYYEDVVPKSTSQMSRKPFTKVAFEKYTMNIDLSALQDEGGEREEIKNTYHMLNIRELTYTIDSLETTLASDTKSNMENMLLRYNGIYNPYNSKKTNAGTIKEAQKDSVREKEMDLKGDALAQFSEPLQARILQSSIDYTNNIVFNTESNDVASLGQIKKLNDHYLALYEKFVIAYSCFLMYFIGAPLGAIIRKGGLGLPIVFAVIIFILYHFVNTFGKKLAQEDGIQPILGAWAGAMVLTPLAIFLTLKATRDNGEVNFLGFFSTIGDFFKGLFVKKHEVKEEENTIE
ncbi:LptF/LptG family permease [Myroides fluvii]|uniref:LptF/LptG family permease n=1 Tax=Myroides fluvii TaxID=2572594 RepID=UPI00131D7948|nr:LptF/LptG family permease [Myroides fluvii]